MFKVCRGNFKLYNFELDLFTLIDNTIYPRCMDDQYSYYKESVNRKVNLKILLNVTSLHAQKQVQLHLLWMKIKLPHLGYEQQIYTFLLISARQQLCPLQNQCKSQFQCVLDVWIQLIFVWKQGDLFQFS